MYSLKLVCVFQRYPQRAQTFQFFGKISRKHEKVNIYELTEHEKL